MAKELHNFSRNSLMRGVFRDGRWTANRRFIHHHHYDWTRHWWTLLMGGLVVDMEANVVCRFEKTKREKISTSTLYVHTHTHINVCSVDVVAPTGAGGKT